MGRGCAADRLRTGEALLAVAPPGAAPRGCVNLEISIAAVIVVGVAARERRPGLAWEPRDAVCLAGDTHEAAERQQTS